MSSILTLAGNNTSSGFYPHTIDQSLRFEDGDSAMLDNSADTFASDGNLKTWTWSGWVKRGNFTNDTGTTLVLFSSGTNNDNRDYLGFSGDLLTFVQRAGGTTQAAINTLAVFRDVSSWYNIQFVFDSTESTSGDRFKIYVNGVRQTLTTSNEVESNRETRINRQSQHNIGSRRRDDDTLFFDGYMADVVFIDGSALGPDSFGETKDGIWVPKDVSGLTFGQNGFHLDFADSSSIGNDVSGQNNDFAVSGLVASDVTEDTPTNNHSTWNPLVSKLNISLSEGNTVVNLDDNASGEADMVSTMVCPLGVDIYGEFKATAFHGGAADSGINIGIIEEGFNRTEQVNTIRQISGGVFYAGNGYLYTDSVASGSAQATYTLNDIIGIKVDRTSDEVKFYKNNVLQWTEDIDATKQYHFGVDSGYTTSTRAISYQGYFAASSWTYTPEDNFLALCTANLPEPEIIDASEYFTSYLYTANNASTRDFTGIGFAPDFLWFKDRTTGFSHSLYDTVRGVNKGLQSNGTGAENSYTLMTAFGDDGFSTSNDGTAGNLLNYSTDAYVAWSWKAGGSAVSNSDGTITSSVSANPEAGFSIVSWSGTSSAGTVGHGLGKVPSMYIVKNRTGGYFWAVYHSGLTNPATSYIDLDNSVGQSTSQTHWNSTAPTNEVFNVNNQLSVNNSSHTYIAYCFADIEGYCKAGSYIGNSDPNGPYVHTGFRPAFLLIKRSDSASHWVIIDTKRSPFNEITAWLAANLSNTESSVGTNNEFDILSNGFKNRNDAGADIMNQSGATYIYLAFAEQPFKYSNAR